MPLISRIAVVNRGEAAMRLIHAVRDLNGRRGGAPIRTIALYTDVDAGAAFVREADETHLLGAAADRPYLDLPGLRKALLATGADAVWVGWGFVAEDPAFAELCAEIGVTFIGPSPEAMRRLGDKIGSKLIAEESGVPVAPWSRGSLDTIDDALAVGTRIGYPFMLKATAGGGGRGIRRIGSADELREAYQRTRDEAERAFGSGVVFAEQLITGARHVEVQVIADGQGTAWALGVRDCSIQRRNQKVIEESASPVLSTDQSNELKASAERLALAVGYAGAGTVEFLYHPGTGTFAFLEVNTRLQVEHPITEAVTGVDLVGLQIRVAGGERLTGERPVERGHAVEARLNAEDPDRGFAPAPGRIQRLELPAGPGIRVDTGVSEGDTIPADFDSMIAKIIAVGADRAEALARLRRAMLETTVIIEGGASNKSFVLALLDEPAVTIGEPAWADTGWIDRTMADGGLVADDHAAIALIAAAIENYTASEEREISHLLTTARGGRPQLRHDPDRTIELSLRQVTYPLTVGRLGPAQHRVTLPTVDGPVTVTARLERIDEVHSRLRVGDQRFRVLTADHGPVQFVEVDGVTHRIARDEGGLLRSPTPALVVGTPVAVGDEVAAGDPVLVLESMKMELVLRAPGPGRVRELLVRSGTQVEGGAVLARLEATDGGAAEDTGAPAVLAVPEDAGRVLTADWALESLHHLLLGYDGELGDPQATATIAAYLAGRDRLHEDGTDALAAEWHLIEVFTDLAELTRNRPAGGDRQAELRVHSSREYLHTYLRTLDPDRGGLPDAFRDRLTRALAHYGVTELSADPNLHAALFRILLAQQCTADIDVVVAILQRWVSLPPPPPETEHPARALLERMVRATQLRFPVVGDLARSIRFAWFDQPTVDAERRQVLDGVAEELTALEDLDAVDRDRRIEALSTVPERLVGFLADRLRRDVRPIEPMLEVLIRRHYRDQGLTGLRLETATGRGSTPRSVVTGEYVSDQHGPTRVISTIGTVDDLAPDGPIGDIVTPELAEDHDSVVELYLHRPGATPGTDETAAELIAALRPQPWVARCRRVSVAVCHDDDTPVGYVTVRPGDEPGTVTEDILVRGMHPMVGRRLNLWRLAEFDVTRLDAPDDVHLYECVAKDNPSDRRLVAAAQVRQMAVVRSADGDVTGLPHAERAVEHCLEAIRRVRTSRGSAGSALNTNHVWITVWPAIRADLPHLTALQDKITPLSDGTGIEEVLAQGRVIDAAGEAQPIAIRFRARPDGGTTADVTAPPTTPLAPMTDYDTRVARARRRGLVYPYELAASLTRGGTLVEHDLGEPGPDGTDRLVPVDRPPGGNRAGIIAAVVMTPTALHPDGVTRVVLCGDPTKALGALAEPECRRVIAAIDLAEEMGVPLEWYAVSAGAKVSMDSGTENLDWVAAALRRIVEFTQAGGEINVVVAGINVGGQPYWNAEATMLMHTKGILVMTPDSAMVLTGKQSLDFSGGVSAEDNYGIGGYDRVMGPNGQAQYWAPDLAGALDIVLAHYDHTWVAAGSAGPRRATTTDAHDRDVTDSPHQGGDFTTVGEIFSATTNPDRKRPFDIRSVMRAVTDADHPMIERWAGMADAETAVVTDARLGGHAVCLIGIESTPVPRAGFPPTDGPDTYNAGTLFPRSSKKVARAINAASGNRPVVVLANLSGFDGSPESMRTLQLEYGAEIGRAMVNFSGPIVFCVISRYHGGAFVVFSKRLNPELTVLAVEGSFASVLGGAPAAAVVFASEVARRAAADPRIAELEQRLAAAPGDQRGAVGVELAELRAALRAEKINEVAAEFDAVHSIHRAVEVGSVDEVIPATRIRPAIIEAIDRKLAAR